MATGNRSSSGGLVYSSGAGRMCPACRQPVAGCICNRSKAAAAQATDGVVRVSRASKGRGGKVVTVIDGLALDPPALAEVGKRLRALCGTGGTVKEGTIELQGDHRERAMEILRQQGHTVKRAGG